MAVAMRRIRALSRQIAREFKPRRIILFGSHAEGRATRDSDVDLLVVMAHEGRSAKKAAEIRLKIRPDFPVDLVVRSPAQLRERIALGDFFMQEVLEKGKVLYEASDPGVGGEGGRGLRHRRTRVAGAPKPQL